MAEYTFWDTDRGLNPIAAGSKPALKLDVSAKEIASYIITDWQPYGYASGPARTIVQEFLDLIIVGDSGKWVMKRQSHLLTRGWKGMISEAIGIALSRHSLRVTKGYNFCVHTDYFRKGGIFYSDLFRVGRGNGCVLRPDYLLAARRFAARPPGMTGEHVCASLEVKGTARNIRGKVPSEEKAQSENINLFRIIDGEEIEIPLRQRLLSRVRVKSTLMTEGCREIDVRHSNFFFFFLSSFFKECEDKLFLTVVLGHYLRILDRMTDHRFTTQFRLMFRHSNIPAYVLRRHFFEGVLQSSKELENKGLAFLSEPLVTFLGKIFQSQQLSSTTMSIDLAFLDKHLERLEQASEELTTEDLYCRPDGIMFRLPKMRD